MSVVAVFVIFGAILCWGQGFMTAIAAVVGRLKGGAAKVSVLSSALFGSISGSASANVASTGMVTLPSMRRLGYPKRVAAAVEAVASTGGQIMPPLMGAGAFVMVELTGIPYTQIIIAAALPAILYFATVWIGVNLMQTGTISNLSRGHEAYNRQRYRHLAVLCRALFSTIDCNVQWLHPTIRCRMCDHRCGAAFIDWD